MPRSSSPERLSRGTGGAVVKTDARVIIARAVDAETGAALRDDRAVRQDDGPVRRDDLTRNVEIATAVHAITTSKSLPNHAAIREVRTGFEPALTVEPGGGPVRA